MGAIADPPEQGLSSPQHLSPLGVPDAEPSLEDAGLEQGGSPGSARASATTQSEPGGLATKWDRASRAAWDQMRPKRKGFRGCRADTTLEAPKGALPLTTSRPGTGGRALGSPTPTHLTGPGRSTAGSGCSTPPRTGHPHCSPARRCPHAPSAPGRPGTPCRLCPPVVLGGFCTSRQHPPDLKPKHRLWSRSATGTQHLRTPRKTAAAGQ